MSKKTERIHSEFHCCRCDEVFYSTQAREAGETGACPKCGGSGMAITRHIEIKPKQTELPGTGIESLPLFSGTAMTAPTSAPAPVRARSQASLFGCSVCHGTGKIKRLYCSCSAGETARLQDRAK